MAACGTFTEPRPSSSTTAMDWMGPRVSFSRDFNKPADPHPNPNRVEAVGNLREISEIAESPARISSSKSSPSEFEFSMSLHGHNSSFENTVLAAADELFHDGKLLPLYTPVPSTSTSTVSSAAEPLIGRRRSNGEDMILLHSHVYNGHDFQQGHRVKIDQPSPISPKAPTCTSRWKELLGLKKVQIQDSNGLRSGRRNRSEHSLAPGRRSLDSVRDQRSHTMLHNEHHQHHRLSHSSEVGHAHLLHHVEAGHHPNQHGLNTIQAHLMSTQSDPVLISMAADPGLCPTTNLQSWQMDRAMSGSRSSKSSEDSDGMPLESLNIQQQQQHQGPCGNNTTTTMVKHRNSTSSVSRARSPTKPSERVSVMSPRRGGRGVSPGRSSIGNRATENSRNAIATRLVVRGLDRSYSSPKPLKKKQEQVRSGRQQRSMTTVTASDGSRPLERSTSYTAGVRVTPVINVPMYITPGLRKGSKNGIFGLSHLFSSKKEKGSKLNHHNHHNHQNNNHHHHNPADDY